ncbi:hypothetical protein FH972_024939 [Carpinus fangiana]|uniref:Uncharacterized protein n=1 Tax=Carpinus fangiana TaxID=176857 RepID=A0A5N6KZJ6_9ROSI|nr:hypothetical protein FH972_024939 [Carpinus fangiana]
MRLEDAPRIATSGGAVGGVSAAAAAAEDSGAARGTARRDAQAKESAEAGVREDKGVAREAPDERKTSSRCVYYYCCKLTSDLRVGQGGRHDLANGGASMRQPQWAPWPGTRRQSPRLFQVACPPPPRPPQRNGHHTPLAAGACRRSRGSRCLGHGHNSPFQLAPSDMPTSRPRPRSMRRDWHQMQK